MKRSKAEEERFHRLQIRAGVVGYEIVETKTGYRLEIFAPDAKLPDPRDLGETDLNVIEQWIELAEGQQGRRR